VRAAAAGDVRFPGALTVLPLGPEGVGCPAPQGILQRDHLLNAAAVLDSLARAIRGSRDMADTLASLARGGGPVGAAWRRVLSGESPPSRSSEGPHRGDQAQPGGTLSGPQTSPCAGTPEGGPSPQPSPTGGRAGEGGLPEGAASSAPTGTADGAWYAGRGLAEALEALGSPLGPLVTEVVHAGERHSRLAEACEETARVLEQRTPLMARGLLLTSNLWTDLPFYAIPVVLIGALLAVVAALACGVVLLAGRSPLEAWHALRKRLPLVGPLYRALVFGRFAQVFAALTRAGVPLARCLELATAATGDARLATDIIPRLLAVREGERLAAVLAACETLPRTVVDILAAGEKSGRLDQAGEKLADYLRDDAEAAVDHISGTAAWLLPCLLGVIVLVAMVVYYGRMAPGGLPGPGEMWHNLLHGPSTGADP
jgi:hypothetical protein